jgi:Zn-dependent protease
MNGDRQDVDADDADEFEESTFSRYLLPIGLFCLTIFTTLWAGAYQDHPNLFHPFRGAWELLTERPGELVNGIPFAATLLLILVTHELAHYVCSKRHRVPASLPLFIPGLPLLVGTFGAIIRVRGQIVERKALFDIGISGPLAGFAVALVALVVGLHWSQVEVGISSASPFYVGRSILIDWCISLVLGDLPRGASVNLHPIAEAAWFGLFVTCLNLIHRTADGGHVVTPRRKAADHAAGVIPVLLALAISAGRAGGCGCFLDRQVGYPPIPDPLRRWAHASGLTYDRPLHHRIPPFPIVVR